MPNELILPGGQPSKDLDDHWQQLSHAGCGGELVYIFKNSESKLAACCKVCKAVWYLDGEKPPDWVPCKPVKAAPGLWLPGKPKGVL